MLTSSSSLVSLLERTVRVRTGNCSCSLLFLFLLLVVEAAASSSDELDCLGGAGGRGTRASSWRLFKFSQRPRTAMWRTSAKMSCLAVEEDSLFLVYYLNKGNNNNFQLELKLYMSL